MNFEQLLTQMYPINSKDNKFKSFIKKHFDEKLLLTYVQELAVYMIAASKVSGATILEKVIYESGSYNLDEAFKEEKTEIKEDDMYFELKEDKENGKYFFLKVEDEVIAIIQEDFEMLLELKNFILN